MENQPNCAFCGYRDLGVMVHQDDLCYAVVSTRPINRYHLLVIPREHLVNFVDLPDDLAARIFWWRNGSPTPSAWYANPMR